jgi:hypothetical protein
MLLAVACCVTAGCAEPLEFADWAIEIPEGTPVREYAPVSMERRDPDAIQLVDELVVGASVDNPAQGVFRPSRVVGTADGTIFVADSAENRIQVYDRNGAFIRTLGREGQGPGEFGNLWGMTIAGDLLVVDDNRNNRFSTWTLDGQHEGDYVKESALERRSRDIRGLPDGTIVARSYVFLPDGEERNVVTRLSLEEGEIARLDEMAPGPAIIPEGFWTPIDFGNAFLQLFQQPLRTTRVAPWLVYVTPVHEYQVLAVSPEGTAAWALRVAWPRPDYSRWAKDYVAWQINAQEQGLDMDTLEWPTGEAWAIEDVLTDGAARLYIVPGVYFDNVPPDYVPADVYSPEGELVAAGYLPAKWEQINAGPRGPWSHAAGEYVYGMREDESGEFVAVRYRLILNER